MDIKDIIGFSDLEKIIVSKHAKSRMTERNIYIEDVISCLADCEIIANYDDDKPFPSCLTLGKSKKGKAMHMVVSRDGEYLYLITAYYPDLEIWECGFKERRK